MKSASLKLSAETVGNNFTFDPELNLPERPRFPPEVMVIPYGQAGLLFEGVRGSQVLNGRGARAFIPSLLKHLNGHNTLQDLVQLFPGVPPKSIWDSIALLYSRGLLEDGASEDSIPDDLSAFAGRYTDVTRVNRNRSEALARIARARLVVGGARHSAEALSAALSGQGFAGVTVATRPDELSAADLFVAMFVGDGDSPAQWLHEAHRNNMRTLHAHVGSDAVEIGPLFIPGRSGCYECLRRLRAAPRGEALADVGFWAGIVALQALHLISRIGVPNVYNICHVHKRMRIGKVYEEQKITRLPGCSYCGLEASAPGASAKSRYIWLLHNAANGLPPRELMSPRDYQYHYAAANIELTKEVAEPFYGAPRVSLPDALDLHMPAAWDRLKDVPHPEITVQHVASLLRFSVGNQKLEGGNRRIAPSGGGMGSAELFAIARGVQGLENGVYHYYAPTHELERLREIPDALILGALGITNTELPSLILVGVGSLMKLRHKYGNFAFRFANLDAGFAKIYLHEVMNALGIRCVEYADARDKVITQGLGLATAGNRNVITFALGVGAPKVDGKPTAANLHHYVDVLIELSSQREWLDRARPTEDIAIVASQPKPIVNDLGAILLARRSVRSFAPHPIPADILTFIAALAAEGDRLCARAGALPVRLKLWVAITVASDGLRPGVYLWDRNASRFVCRRKEVSYEDLDATMLQRSLARAPAVFFITGDFEHATGNYGARGYRELISRAGAIVARALIVAGAYRVSGCPWGGLAEDAWGDLLSIDRYTDCPLFGVSLGYPNDG